jgi:hypothetical protein
MNVGFMDVLLFTFLISGLLRLVVAVIFLPMIKEVKIVKKFAMPGLFKHLHIIRGTVFEIASGAWLKGRKNKRR